MRKLSMLIAVALSAIACASSPSTPSIVKDPAALTVASPGPGDTPRPDGPTGNGPWVGAAAASDALLAGSQDTFVAVWVDVPRTQADTRPPAAVALTIDTSGSMAGDKISNARKAAAKFVEQLKDGDMVSLTTFSDAASERVPLTRLDASSRQRIASVIAELRADGGTNLFEGVRLAGLSVMSSPTTHPVRRVVLVSDGLATVGTTSKDMIALLGEKAGDRGVQVTSIGVGLDYDENTLNQLAIRSSGRLFHMEKPEQLASILSTETELLRGTRATNAMVEFVPAPGVQVVGVEGLRSIPTENGFRIPLGSMFAGQHKEFIVRARTSLTSAGSMPIASVRLLFQDPNEGNLERVQEAVARVDVVNDPTVAEARRNERAQGIFAMLDASKATERAIAMVDTDDFGGADRELAKAETSLRAQASKSKDKEERKRLEESAARVGRSRAGASAAAAAPPAAKPAAKRATVLEANDAKMDLLGF